MTRQGVDADTHCVHHDIRELLPWYVNGTLAARELEKVVQHLAVCLLCQGESKRWEVIATATHLADDTVDSAAPEQFAALMVHIEAAEAMHQPQCGWWGALYHGLRSYGAAFSGIRRWAHCILAMEAGLILLLASGLMWRSQSGPGALYTTLSESPDQAPQEKVQIRVIFAEDIQGKQLHELLTSVKATIVRGPSMLGAYTVEVPRSARSADTLSTVLEVFRSHDKVQLAEPASAR